MSVEGKTVLVTGANRGIGQALADEALRRGAKRVHAGTRQPLAQSDERVTPLMLDVTDAAYNSVNGNFACENPTLLTEILRNQWGFTGFVLSDYGANSRLWLGIAAAIAMVGGARGRRAALEGVAAIGVTSATVNLGVKPLARRRRPDRAGPDLVAARHIPMPGSASFPSGHAASAFAFAYAVGRHLPGLGLPIRLLAGGVAYSRVHTGVHYPGDVVMRSILGAATAAMVAAACDRVPQPEQGRRLRPPVAAPND
jgi:membrane-associated phospholipid phosphatase